MTAPAVFTLPADAFEKADAKVKAGGADHYADLSDEERAEEGLPARETEKKPEATPEPEKKPEPAKEPEPEKKPEPTPEPEPEEEPEADPAITALFEEIAGLREDISAATGKPEGKPEGEEDALIAAAREHDDPVVQQLGERLVKAEQRLAAQEKTVRTERINQQKRSDDAEFDAVQKSFVIADKPMTDTHIEQVEDYMLAHPAVAAELSIEQITRLVFPDAVKALATTTEKPPARSPGKAPEKEPAVATIVDVGASGGAPKEPWKPGPNETIESAVKAAGRRFGWTR